MAMMMMMMMMVLMMMTMMNLSSWKSEACPGLVQAASAQHRWRPDHDHHDDNDDGDDDDYDEDDDDDGDDDYMVRRRGKMSMGTMKILMSMTNTTIMIMREIMKMMLNMVIWP